MVLTRENDGMMVEGLPVSAGSQLNDRRTLEDMKIPEERNLVTNSRPQYPLEDLHVLESKERKRQDRLYIVATRFATRFATQFATENKTKTSCEYSFYRYHDKRMKGVEIERGSSKEKTSSYQRGEGRLSADHANMGQQLTVTIACQRNIYRYVEGRRGREEKEGRGLLYTERSFYRWPTPAPAET